MAVIERKTRLGMRYTAVYRTVDGSQKSAGTFASRKEAEAAYWDAAVKVSKGIDPSVPETVVSAATAGGKVTVESYVNQWLPDHKLEPHSRRSYEGMMAAHILPRFGSKPVAELTTREIASWPRDLEKKGKSAAVVAKVKAVLSAMCQAAAEEGLLPVNPVRGIPMVAERIASYCQDVLADDTKHSGHDGVS